MSLFGYSTFRSTIRDYCKRCGWRIAEIDDSHAQLIFTMESGQDQYLYIIPYESTLEFSVPSFAAYDEEDDIPHELSTKLLLRNSDRRIGFWCIEDINDQYVFSIMHNAEMQLINAQYFKSVVEALVLECEEFEETLRRFMQPYSRRRPRSR